MTNNGSDDRSFLIPGKSYSRTCYLNFDASLAD